MDCGTLDELKQHSNTNDVLKIQTTGLNSRIINQLKEKFSCTYHGETDMLFVNCTNINKEILNVVTAIQNFEVKINSLETKKANLEAIFLNLTGKQLRD